MKVAVLGDVIVDRYVSCDAVDVASESPMLSLLQLSEQEYLGGAAIVARHAAAMGAHVTLVSNVARDQCSARVNSILASGRCRTGCSKNQTTSSPQDPLPR